MQPEKRDFHTLDGLRGIAALGVFAYHFNIFFAPLSVGGRSLFPEGFLAVDLFFCLSGFVIEHAYGRKLAASMSAARFTVIRVIRLYPLYLCGAVIGIASGLVALFVEHMHFRPYGGGDLLPVDFVVSGLAAILMLPSPTWSQSDALFVFNGPAWSLFFELLVNVAFAFIYGRLNRRTLWIILLFSGALLTLAATVRGSMDVGPTWEVFLGGFPRVIFSFFAGVLLYRLHSPRRLLGLRAILIPLLPLLLFQCAPLPGLRVLYDEVCVMLLFPLIIAQGALWEPPARLLPVFRLLGAISFPLYAIHVPLLELCRRACKFLHLNPQDHAWGALFGTGAVLILTSYFLVIVYDEPVRKRLTRALSRSNPAAKTAAVS
jgi:peptidoglycan/LPS O-acetylase OafA/YrhL